MTLVTHADYRTFKGYCSAPSEFNGLAIPCRTCKNCRNWRNYQWKYRLKMEIGQTARTWFCTFTFRDRKLPTEITTSWQKYTKRLRKASNKELRYFTVLEHGSKNGRAHLHSLFFCQENPLTWREINASWKDGFLKLNIIHDTTSSHIGYVCKYATKESAKIYASQKIGYPASLPRMGQDLPRWYYTQWKKKWNIPF